MHSLIVALGAVRAPIIVTLLALCLVILPDQSREVFRVIGEAQGRDFLLAAGQSALSALACALVVGASALLLVRFEAPYRAAAVARHRALLETLPSALPFAIIAGITIANIGAGGIAARPRAILAITVLVSAAFVVLLLWQGSLRSRLNGLLLAALAPALRLNLWQGLVAIALAIGLVIAAVVQQPGPFAAVLGPLGVVFLFFATLCIAASLLGTIYDRHQVPVIAILGILAVVWASVPTNDNHQIRLAPTTGVASPDAADQFRDWLLARPDLADYGGRPYPVYIVTAEGNGLYAAAHAAFRLAAIQDNCPAFARHVFAISAVSGGSLGAAVFSALVKANPPRRELKPEEKCPLTISKSETLQKAVGEYFKEDFLTPLIAAGLFPDFFQRFWPRPIPEFDRARALEDGFDRAWRRVAINASKEVQEIFPSSSRKLWSTKEDQPALLLNTTVVHSGERVVIAPFQLLMGSRDPYHFLERDIDLFNNRYPARLDAAVGASARFPLVTPPASYDGRQLVDGAYYENSGIFTALDIAGRLRQAFSPARSEVSAGCEASNLLRVRRPARVSGEVGSAGAADLAEGGPAVAACIKFITIYSGYVAKSKFHSGEIWAPVAAMLEARQAKGRANILLARFLYCGGERCGGGSRAERPHIYGAIIDPLALGLPLGWQLSKLSLAWVREAAQLRDACPSFTEPWPTEELARRRRIWIEENGCLYSRIARDLTGR